MASKASRNRLGFEGYSKKLNCFNFFETQALGEEASHVPKARLATEEKESHPLRQLGNEVIGSPATRARQPFFGEISSRFEFSIKFEPTFLTGSLAVCLSAPVPAYSSGKQGEAGGRGVWGEIPPAEPSQFRSDIFKQTPPNIRL